MLRRSVEARSLTLASVCAVTTVTSPGRGPPGPSDTTQMLGLLRQPARTGWGAGCAGERATVVEVDLDTGKVEMVRHVAVDDAGTVINELI